MSTNGFAEPSWADAVQQSLRQRFQHWLDLTVPFLAGRWIGYAILFLIYCIRVYSLEGFYVVSYALGIFLLHLLIGFISPQEDLDVDGPVLPMKGSDEFKPFQRRLPEFKTWYAAFKATSIALFATLFPFVDIPVFWPVLLVYFLALVFLTMKKQINHMIKHRYVPFSWGKKRYTKPSSSGISLNPLGSRRPSK